jgi:hypothetical protein
LIFVDQVFIDQIEFEGSNSWQHDNDEIIFLNMAWNPAKIPGYPNKLPIKQCLQITAEKSQFPYQHAHTAPC